MSQSLARTAAIMCGNPNFQQHLGVTCKESAAAHVRAYCGITSRRQLDTNKDAAERFHTLRRRFAYREAA